ncbi:zinc finger BED domain-containing protein RICESLEEPER 2-like [Olea europaea var. sylvestris]|uniref:zinc finger BED domain-containing protein RICESLEEPER 2-like n=1 Tax=Olea europaea var. sylvestris TaxID=158386 RepID=UPI000C1D77A1|nr:zinc finger BED domain-containing protein RICESLEEPER 2-like [Olea europaea var. sylvestris]
MKLEGKCKKGNKRSEVWDHFKIRGDEKAECNYCRQTYKHHAKNCGTSTLWNHIMHLCKKYPYRVQDKKQKKMTGYNMLKIEELSKGIDSHEESVKFAQKEVRKQITTYFILSELPFRHVEDEGFQGYTRYFFPSFVFPSRMTVDNDRKLQKRIISFIQVPSHKGDMVGKELISCLKDWGINKIFCVTVDNASSNDVALLRLKSCFEEKKDGLVLGGKMLHMRCCAHILNPIVCDGLKEISHAISAIRNAVRFVRSSPERLNRFKESCKEANIESRALLCLDITTRWNSTYLMLQAATNGSKYVTSNSFFQEICEIHVELNELAKQPNTLMGSMAIILDPRCKLELLKVGFELIYDVEIAKMLLKRVEETLHRLYACYEEMATPITPPSASSKEATKNSSSSPSQPTFGLSKQIPSIFKAKLMQNMQSEKNDLVDYLSDHCEDLTNPKFDVLVWWKLNVHKYKILSKIAKDVLAIQISTVASESAFSTSGWILNSFRSSLSAKMVEALICTKNWLHSSNEPIVFRQYLDEVELLNDSAKAVEEAESCSTTGSSDPIFIK